MSDDAKQGHEVGYKKPPRHTQFKKGQSGNPKGRPKSARGLKTDLKAELIGKMNIRVNGQDMSGTKQQLMLRTLTLRAASGDISATRVLINLVMQVLGPEDHQAGRKKLSALDQEILDQLLMRKAPQEGAATTSDNKEPAGEDRLNANPETSAEAKTGLVRRDPVEDPDMEEK